MTRWRYFFAHQDSAQETWLESQARKGLHLTRPGLFRFEFAQGAPTDAPYRLDFQMLRGAARDEYLGLFRDAGWEFMGQVANRYYFRARPGAISPEIFSDVESKRERIRRQMRVAGMITALLVLQVALAASKLLEANAGQSTSVAVLTLTIAGGFACMGGWMIWQLEQGYKRLQ